MPRTVTRFENRKPETKKRVAAYCRVSTDKDAQQESLENQMEAFRFRLALHSDWELVKIYADEGLSGTSVKGRVKFQTMIEDCEAGKIDCILTKSISRFARNTLDCIGYVRKLQKLGIQVYFDKEGIDTGETASEMLLTIMASFAQEESRSISENTKWGIRKRFEDGKEIRVPLYGYVHTREETFQIVSEEAEVVREIFERYVHGEAPKAILEDMVRRGVRPPAGDCWKRQQLDRMLRNEKYAGDSVLQKTYVEDHLTHRQIRNKGEVPMFHVADGHSAIVDRHIFDQAQAIMQMRKVNSGNSTYPYGEMLRCPHCGKSLTHGTLNNFTCNGTRIRNGGWGCYGQDGCGKYLLIQRFLDAAIIRAYNAKYSEAKENVDFYWLDDCVERIELGEDSVVIRWRDGEESTEGMEIDDEYLPGAYAAFYNGVLGRVATGERKNHFRNLMGVGGQFENKDTGKRIRSKTCR